MVIMCEFGLLQVMKFHSDLVCVGLIEDGFLLCAKFDC